ncbi:Imm52 family immunity protein [Hyalangium gracile]|uniref:Imm52 family immunity protein n=1 Tax=Hyalangium gracile TaxID=394092 RepID=UPI003898E727
MGAYWGARKEDAEACARRLVKVVQLLQPVDPLFARWFKSARSLKQSLTRPLELEVETICRKHRTSSPRSLRRASSWLPPVRSQPDGGEGVARATVLITQRREGPPFLPLRDAGPPFWRPASVIEPMSFLRLL